VKLADRQGRKRGDPERPEDVPDITSRSCNRSVDGCRGGSRVEREFVLPSADLHGYDRIAATEFQWRVVDSTATWGWSRGEDDRCGGVANGLAEQEGERSEAHQHATGAQEH
jgi:hypothetical protein